jgi:hypothetical protein
LDYVDLIIHVYVFLILLVAYLVLNRAYHDKPHSQRKESQDIKEFVTSIPQLKQVLNDVERANEISENSLELLVNAKNQQQNLKADVDRACPFYRLAGNEGTNYRNTPTIELLVIN